MTNRVKYASVRKYRDVGFNEPDKKEERVIPKTSISLKEKEERIRPRRSILINKKKNLFQRIWYRIKSFKNK
jgi:hypothetical protein